MSGARLATTTSQQGEPKEAASEATPSAASSRETVGRRETGSAAPGAPSVQLNEAKGRYHPRLFKLMSREILEEQRRFDRVAPPTIPKGWQYSHNPLNHYFTMLKRMEMPNRAVEEMRVFCPFEIKDYENTYRIADGERDENQHYTFTVFLFKPDSAAFTGGLEFTLTCIETELVLDAMAIHSTREDLETAWTKSAASQEKRDAKYRGPYINELDDDLADEIINYLDDRGINNAFAEFVTQQSIHAEDECYLHWLRLLRQFASKEKVL